jgi:hypothetical protein
VWLDPERTWPISIPTYVFDSGMDPIDCFDGNVVLSPALDTYAVVDAGGASVTFFDEASMGVDTVRTDHSAGPEIGRRVVSWVDGDVLALAYGAPESGVVAHVDLRLRKVIRTAVPPPCASSAP